MKQIFTRIHYKWLANFVRREVPLELPAGKQVVIALAQNLAEDNARFDRKKFFTACGMGSWLED